MYLRESFEHLRCSFAASATLDHGDRWSWLRPEAGRHLLVPKMLVPRPPSSSYSSSSSSPSALPSSSLGGGGGGGGRGGGASSPQCWSFVGLEHWLEEEVHPAVFEGGFLRQAREIYGYDRHGANAHESHDTPRGRLLPEDLAADVAGWARQVRSALLAVPEPSPPVARFRAAMDELCRVVGVGEDTTAAVLAPRP